MAGTSSSLGAKVYPNAEREIGWLPVEGLPPPKPGLFAFPRSLTAFHWHGETFDLPSGRFAQDRNAILSAGAEAYESMAALLESLRDYSSVDFINRVWGRRSRFRDPRGS